MVSTWHADAIQQTTNYYAEYSDSGGSKLPWGNSARGDQNRLLSASVQLIAGDAYTGGALQVFTANATRKQGSAVIFPSYQLHRVYPVQSGERFALVAWMRGEECAGRYWHDAEKKLRELSENEPAIRKFWEPYQAASGQG